MTPTPTASGPLRLLVGVTLLWFGVRGGALWWDASSNTTSLRPRLALQTAAVVGEEPVSHTISPAHHALASRLAASPRTFAKRRGAIADRLRLTGGKPGRVVAAVLGPHPAAAWVATADPTGQGPVVPGASASGASPSPAPDATDGQQKSVGDGSTSLHAPPRPLRPASGRWSGGAYIFARSGSGADPVTPSLGGTQAMVEGRYRLTRRVEAMGRLSADRHGADAALGLSARIAGTPLAAAAWRRQGIATRGRDATLATLSGGRAARVGPLDIETYATVGARVAPDAPLRDPEWFAESAIAARARIGAAAVGPAMWSAAQRDTRRVDVGLSFVAPLGRHRVALDWRQRITGNAAPAHGPTLTLSSGF